MAFPSIPHPNPTALALAFGGLLLAPRRPAAGRRAGRPGGRLPARPRRGGAGRRGAAGGGGAARRARRSPGAAVACRADGAGRDRRAGATSGTRRSASRSTSRASSACRCPGAWHGGFEPNKILEHYYPYVLLAGVALWLVGGDPRPRCRPGSGPPHRWPRAGVVYLLARADVFHLVPLAAVLPVLLATGRGERAAAGLDGARWWSCSALIALQGLDLKRIQLLDPPPLGDDRRRRGGRREGADGRGARARPSCSRYVRARVPPGEPDVRGQPALRPGPGRQPARLRAGRPPQPHALRRDAARRGHDGAGAARDHRRPRALAAARW